MGRCSRAIVECLANSSRASSKPSRVLANIAPSACRETLSLVRIASTSGGDPRELSVVEAIQLALVWRVARQAFGMEDIDPLADLGSPTSPGALSGATPSTTPAKKVKAALVLDRSRQILQHREPQEFACMDDQSHGAAEEIHAHRTGVPRPVPLRCGDSQNPRASWQQHRG